MTALPLAARGLLAALALLGPAATARAQGVADLDAPIGWFVVDLSGVMIPWGQDIDLASRRGFDPLTQPSLGLGVSGGVHVYPLRWRFVTFGLGASVVTATAERRPDPNDADPDGPTLRKRFMAIAPQLSFNFGGRDGWSYVSAGPGESGLTLFDRDAAEPSLTRGNAFNYGGGARWFTSDHLAFALDLRFYNASPRPATDTDLGSNRTTTMVLSIGASFK